MAYLRPLGLDDRVYDFVAGATFKQGFTALNEPPDTGVYYVIGTTAGSVGTPTLLFPTTIKSASGDPSYPGAKPGSNVYVYLRDIPAAGFYDDDCSWTYATAGLPPTPSNPFPKPGVGYRGNKLVQWYALQKAVAVIRLNGAIAVSATSFTMDINTNFTILLESRGVRTENWSMEYKNTSSVWVTAVDGVDYQTVSVSGRTIVFKFLKVAEFRLTNKVNGNTSTSNPYPAISFTDNPRLLVTVNEDSHILYFTATDPNVDPDDPDPEPTLEETILFPKIKAHVDAYYEIVDDPLKTYSGIGLKVTPQIQFGTGSWKIGGITQVKTDAEWITALTTNCNIKLHVTRVDGSAVFAPLDGLGTKEFTIKEVGELFFNYITTLK